MSSTPKQCPVCLENYKQPKFLNCHHTFCIECIRLMATGLNQIVCPLCKKVMQLPNDLKDLPTNFYLDVEDSPSAVVGDAPSTLGWSRKLLDLDFRWGKKHQKHSIQEVTLKFELSKCKNEEYGEVLAIDIQLPSARKYFVLACNIEYDIKLINQKNRSISTNQKGQLHLKDKRDSIPLIRYTDAMDEQKGFIIRQTVYCQVFQVEMKLKVSAVKLVDFNIPNQSSIT